MGNGITQWQWSSALQTMAYKHPLTSGQMRERRGGGWARGLRDCMFVCASTCVNQSDRIKAAVTWGETALQSSREMVRKISPWGMMWWADTLPLKTNVPCGSEFKHASAHFKSLPPLHSLDLPSPHFPFSFYQLCLIWSLAAERARRHIYTLACFLMRIPIQYRKLQRWKPLTWGKNTLLYCSVQNSK